MLWCRAGEVSVPSLPGAGSAAGAGPGVRVRAGGVQRLPAAAGCLPCGRGEDHLIPRCSGGSSPLAKRAPERAWLGEVASVALVQACRDARRAYRNWFDSPVGEAEGPQGRAPGVPVASTTGSRSGSPGTVSPLHGHQAVRGEGRGHQGRVVPGSAFRPVVGHGDPRAGRPVLRLVRGGARGHPAARLSSRDRRGCRAVQAGRHVGRRGDRAIRGSCGRRNASLPVRSGRCPASRKAQRTGRKPARRVAVEHRKVREARLDHAHKTALRLVRDNQAVYAEDLVRVRAGPHQAGQGRARRGLVSARAPDRGKGCPVRADVGEDRPVRAHQPGVLGVRGEGRPEAAACPRSGRARRAGRATTGT